ncbi:MAG: translocation/assembly module TamB domain-containing protein [Bacteroides sp.]|nr:translocation/assembly module TamB domain-containing protein [Bacteroides sp.]
MKKKWLKRAVWILLAPVLLFIVLMVLLYVPPVQSFLRQQVTEIASEATGMNISVKRIDLRFPLDLLVRGVLVVQPTDTTDVQRADTLLDLESLDVRIQAWPLLKGKVEVDEVTLKQVAINSGNMVEGMQVKGVLGNFFLESHGIDLSTESVILNNIELSDTHLQVMMADTTSEADVDTTSTALNWKVSLHTLNLKNVSVDLDMPLDTMRLTTHLGDARIEDAEVDLGKQLYGWRRFQLSETALAFDMSEGEPADGFDASHIALRDITVGIDSVLMYGRNMNAVVREFSMNERSGLSVTSVTGRFFADSTVISVPSLRLSTPHSEMALTAQTYWELVNIPTTGRLSARFDARIGKQDVMLFAGDLPETFKEAYPFRPLVIRAGTEGNLKQMQISRFMIDLPGAFSLKGGGELWHLSDSLRRNGSLDFEMLTHNLNFLTGLTGVTPDGSIVIPDSMGLKTRIDIEGPRYTAMLKLRERGGAVNLDAFYDMASEAYQAGLIVDSLQLHHFLPQDSIYMLSAKMFAKGRGTDITSHRTKADLQLALDELQYGHWNVSDVNLKAELESAVATVNLTSNNSLLKMQADADMRLDRTYLDGKLALDVEQVGMYELGLAPGPLKRPFAFTLGAEARQDSIKLRMDAGDLNLRFRAHSTLKKLMEQSDEFMQVLMAQIEDRHLDHAALRRLLPSAGMHLKGGRENPIGYFLAAQNVTYDDFKFSFGFTPEIGINGRTAIHGLRMDSLQLDTIFFAIRQDTTRMQLQGGVINGPDNPQFVFRSKLTGEIRNDDAELTAEFVDGEGETGLLLGINARPLTEGHGRGNGMLLQLTPAEPIVAFRKFKFAEKCNWIYVHKDMRVYANVDMDSDDGLCFRMQSDRSDTVSLQNMNVELSRFRLSELSEILPYMPRITGLFSAEAKYIQTATSLQLSAEANIEQLTYEKQKVGDIGLGATWLPGDDNTHYLNTYFTFDDEEVMTLDGVLAQKNGKDTLDMAAVMNHFPLRMVNAFVPDRMVTLAGDVDGELQISGSPDVPVVNGNFAMDSASVYARQAGASFRFDNRPVMITNNKLTFDKFAIYAIGENPFTIDGDIDFRNLDRPMATLNLRANNYTLLDAPRTRESLVYGKVCVDLMATLRGPLDGLMMRGNMNLRGNTDVTYVLTDSPLTVEDRLDGLVTFTSFSDTTSVTANEVAAMPMGGMNVIMTMHIDDAVRLRADLSSDRSKYIELEGGGDLNLQYTPQGDMTMSGRYTLTGGTMKYSLPVIPLKEFEIASGSYVDWRGDIMNPTLNLTATETVRASVSDDDDSGSRTVSFNVSISIKNNLTAPELVFDISAPDDATVQNELQAMDAEERSKQAIAMLATGVYLNSGLKGGGLNMGSALNSVLQSQINSLAGSALQSANASFSVGVEDRTDSSTGDTQTDYSFRYSQRFFNDRVQIVIGGTVSTGANATNDVESFIDNVSLEYRLDTSGTRYVRVFHNKNNESILDGEITETGVGVVLRRKMDRLGELFLFGKKKKKDMPTEDMKDEKETK